MLTTVIAGRVWDFSHALGRNAAAGKGFAHPSSIALASKGVAYVVSRGTETNFGSRVTKVFVGAPGEEDVLGEFGYYGTGDGQLQWPNSVALDRQGNVYVSDEWRSQISVFDIQGQFLSRWGTPGSGRDELDGPAGLAFDQDDNLLVVDSRNHRIQQFTKDGQFMSGWGTPGRGPGQFQTPWGITVANGAVYVADWKNHRVQKFDHTGRFQMQFGPGEGAQALNHPSDVAVDDDGDVYVCDWANHKVRIYTPEGEPLTSLIGDAQVLAKWAQESVDANPDMAKMRRRVKHMEPEWRFCYPTAVAFDTEHSRLIVADNQRGRLQIYNKVRDYLEPQFNL
ncbi:MAG TPA: NHL repeat-containing protein [Candidatus Tectomicrobia bacterium]|jgi:sugar lactone lactonase YvrE